MPTETMCVFSPDGVLQETHRLSNPNKITPTQMFEEAIKKWPAGTRVCRYSSQEMLPESKLGVAVGNATLAADGLTFRINSLDAIRARLTSNAIASAEAEIIGMTKEIEAIAITMSMLGEHRSYELMAHYESLISQRQWLVMVVRKEAEPRIHVDENLSRIAGECFAVCLDPSTVSG